MALLVSCGWGMAQSEFSAGGGGGLSTLKATTDMQSETGMGFKADLGYSYFFGEHLGVGTGIGIALFSGQLTASGSSSYLLGQTDSYGETYDLHTTLRRYSEKQKASMLAIPLVLRYRMTKGGGLRAGLGSKIFLPITVSYSAEPATVYNEGYYTRQGVLINMPAFAGFGAFSRAADEGALKFKPSVALTAELGYSFRLVGRLQLYAGAWIDYGLTDLRNNAAAPMTIVNAASPKDFTLRSVTDATGKTSEALVRKLFPIAAGLELRIIFGSSSYSRQPSEYRLNPNEACY